MGRILEIPTKDKVGPILTKRGYQLKELSLRKTSRGDLSITGVKEAWHGHVAPFAMTEAVDVMATLQNDGWCCYLTSYTKKVGPMTYLAYRVIVEGKDWS
jgi:hypothetical protein